MLQEIKIFTLLLYWSLTQTPRSSGRALCTCLWYCLGYYHFVPENITSKLFGTHFLYFFGAKRVTLDLFVEENHKSENDKF